MKPYNPKNFLTHSATDDSLLAAWITYLSTGTNDNRLALITNQDESKLHLDLAEVAAILQVRNP